MHGCLYSPDATHFHTSQYSIPIAMTVGCWVKLADRLHTEVVCPNKESQYWPSNFVDVHATITSRAVHHRLFTWQQIWHWDHQEHYSVSAVTQWGYQMLRDPAKKHSAQLHISNFIFWMHISNNNSSITNIPACCTSLCLQNSRKPCTSYNYNCHNQTNVLFKITEWVVISKKLCKTKKTQLLKPPTEREWWPTEKQQKVISNCKSHFCYCNHF